MTDETAARLERAAADCAEKLFGGDPGGHDRFHTLRVARTALYLAGRTGADPHVTALAALLHDVDDRKLSPGTAGTLSNAAAVLSDPALDEAERNAILTAIREVSFRGTDSVTPSTLEGMCVQDADRLDAVGAVGIARAFAYGGSRGRKLYDPNEPPETDMDGEAYARRTSHTVNHFYEKLLKLKDMMNTEPAKRIAAERDRFMRAFLDEFYAEWRFGDNEGGIPDA